MSKREYPYPAAMLDSHFWYRQFRTGRVLNVVLLIVAIIAGAPDLRAGSTLEFFEGKWSALLEKARMQNKPVYIYWGAEHCGPCRVFERTVITNAAVIDYLNERFICYRFDGATASEYHHIRDSLRVDGFPTHMFLDAGGVMRNLVMGIPDSAAYYPVRFTAWAEAAIDTGKGYFALRQKYVSGDRNPEFLHDYLLSARNAGAEDFQQLLAEYLSMQPEDSLGTEGNLYLLQGYWDNLQSREYKWVEGHYQELAEKNGEFFSIDLRLRIAFRHMLRSRYPTRADREAGIQVFEKWYDQLVDARNSELTPLLPLYMDAYYAAKQWEKYGSLAVEYIRRTPGVTMYWLCKQADECFWRVKNRVLAQLVLEQLRGMPQEECDASCQIAQAKLLVVMGDARSAEELLHRVNVPPDEAKEIEYEMGMVYDRLKGE